MLTDFIQELKQTDIYQMILAEGLKEGREKGLQEGRQTERAERLHDLRQMLMALVTARFPELSALAREVAASTNEPAILSDLVVSVGLAQQGEELRQRLLAQTNGRSRQTTGESNHQEQ
jgi:predicted transposase YdaD